MGYTTLWKRLSPRKLNVSIQIFSLISIFFEGYDQGVMGGVNASPRYVQEVGIGRPNGVVTDTVHQGGIVSVYYLGCIVGCFAGGWVADRVGRINGHVRTIPEGVLNLGISVAYWLSFGLAFINNGYSDIRWRLLLAFQCLPALLLLTGVKMLPDSPRYLAIAGKHDEAREVLEHIRGSYNAEVEMEYLEVVAVAEESKKSSPLQFAKILIGKGGKTGRHLGRRAWLCMWLQIMASWTGITAVTAYSPTLLSQAGYSALTQSGLSAVTMLFLFNICYAATWGTVAFLIPTEIWSSDMRAQGNGFGITGWAVGVGWTVLVNPLMLATLKNRAYFLLAGLNLMWIPIVYLFYPETAGRSLESIDVLFSTSSPLSWKMEQAYREHGDMLVEPEASVSFGKSRRKATASKAQEHGIVGTP
ncbi:hypothetical protein SLS55_006261 [Diplodia seriata]|uniref:Sugar transporter STL1 n=1 Tax=Diplodia seriata TaxID=420778 RepID=A0ABR3CDS0_9PEZI